jgi:AcrR family transcriptional regulator
VTTEHAAARLADPRSASILRAAEELLEEGGYAALTVRAIAARAGISQGLLYYYFEDRHAVFAALMMERQSQMAEFLDGLPRDRGLEDLLRRLVPEAAAQWRLVGRMSAIWDIERGDSGTEIATQLHASSSAQFAALTRALTEAAAAEGRPLRTDGEVTAFVWSGLMGLADILVRGWTRRISKKALIEHMVTALAEQARQPA